MRITVKDILFWIFLLLALALLLWNVLGNSPTEFVTLITLIFTVLLKLWSVSDKQIRLEMRFNALVRDFKEYIKNNSR